MQKYSLTLFLFRRDLRLDDNTALIASLNSSERVIPAFIFTPDQIDSNPYRSDHCLKFMIESLSDLSRQIESRGGSLFFFKGDPDTILEVLILQKKIQALFLNRDYTPYSKQRDEKLKRVCDKLGVMFHTFDDALLHAPEQTVKKDGTPYRRFTPYFQNVSKTKVSSPVLNRMRNYYRGQLPYSCSLLKPPDISNSLIGGRTEGLKILKKHNAQAEISHLSPHLKFNTCSIREVYVALKHDKRVIRALYWRDFFTSIAFFFPHVFNGAFDCKFDRVKWSCNKHHFERWCKGETGFPIVDAGMREMNETGFMSNRLRMITASFLVKDLHINWQWGERYFAQTLVDYDPALNNGNWQWVAGTGCDRQPYFRTFNPWIQQRKFDPECSYIQKWIPELKNLAPSLIHKWEKSKEKHNGYPPPMVLHQKEANKSKIAYSNINDGETR